MAEINKRYITSSIIFIPPIIATVTALKGRLHVIIDFFYICTCRHISAFKSIQAYVVTSCRGLALIKHG